MHNPGSPSAGTGVYIPRQPPSPAPSQGGGAPRCRRGNEEPGSSAPQRAASSMDDGNGGRRSLSSSFAAAHASHDTDAGRHDDHHRQRIGMSRKSVSFSCYGRSSSLGQHANHSASPNSVAATASAQRGAAAAVTSGSSGHVPMPAPISRQGMPPQGWRLPPRDVVSRRSLDSHESSGGAATVYCLPAISGSQPPQHWGSERVEEQAGASSSGAVLAVSADATCPLRHAGLNHVPWPSGSFQGQPQPPHQQQKQDQGAHWQQAHSMAALGTAASPVAMMHAGTPAWPAPGDDTDGLLEQQLACLEASICEELQHLLRLRSSIVTAQVQGGGAATVWGPSPLMAAEGAGAVATTATALRVPLAAVDDSAYLVPPPCGWAPAAALTCQPPAAGPGTLEEKLAQLHLMHQAEWELEEEILQMLPL